MARRAGAPIAPPVVTPSPESGAALFGACHVRLPVWQARLPPVRGENMPSRSQPFPQAEARRWGRYSGAPSDEQLSRFFVLGPADLQRADRARSEVTRLG